MPNSHSRHVDDELSLTSETRNCSTSRKWSRIFVVHVCTYVYVLHTLCTYHLVIEDFAMEKSPCLPANLQDSGRSSAKTGETWTWCISLWRPTEGSGFVKNIGGNNKNNPLVNHKIASFNGYSLWGVYRILWETNLAEKLLWLPKGNANQSTPDLTSSMRADKWNPTKWLQLSGDLAWTDHTMGLWL